MGALSFLDDLILYIWAGAELFVVMILAAYALINLAHPGDLAFAKSCCARFLIWIGFIFIFLPVLTVYLDVVACTKIHDQWDRIENGIIEAVKHDVPIDREEYAEDLAVI